MYEAIEIWQYKVVDCLRSSPVCGGILRAELPARALAVPNELDSSSRPLAVTVYSAHPLPFALEPRVSAEEISRGVRAVQRGRVRGACTVLTAVPAPTTTTRADSTTTRTRTVTTAAANDGETGTGGQQNGGPVSTPDDGRHHADNTMTAGQMRAQSTCMGATAGMAQALAREQRARARQAHGRKHGHAAEISFFEDLPFLDDPDDSDEQVMHGVEAVSGSELNVGWLGICHGADVMVDSVSAANDEVPIVPVSDKVLATPPENTVDTVSVNNGPTAETADVGRKKRKRAPAQKKFDVLNVCLCGSVATFDDELPVLKCKVAGCETQWYHLSCVELEQAPRNWVCEACEVSGRVKGGKRLRK
ncbi:hypothetical protein BJ912DRAFT_933163 [Pholiota molesta]|nr:hypothetical protein BJ912DRAFT_933163 [Pholiota molesta]